MRAQRHALEVFGVESLDDFRPEHSRRAHFCDFHKVVFAYRPEEAESRRKLVDFKAGLFAASQIFEPVRERVRHFEVCGGSRFLHMVAGNGDAVELRHILRGVREYVADYAHRGFRGIDVGVADHELLQNVVLNGSGELFELCALFQACDYIECENRKNGAVHRHGNGHLRKRDLVEQHFHIHNGIDSNARLADVADYARVVGVIASVGREVESNGEAFLPCREVAAVECVGFFGCREACVLANRPRAHYVHRGVRSPKVRRYACRKAEVFHSFVIGRGVERLYGNLLHRVGDEIVELAAGLLFYVGLPLFEGLFRFRRFKRHFCKVGIFTHFRIPFYSLYLSTPRLSSIDFSVW